MTVNIQIKGLKKLRGKMGDLAGMEAVKTGIEAAALHTKGVVAKYPAQKRGLKQPPKTAKQRRYLHWAFRNGVLDFPYRRGQSPGSKAFGRKWTIATKDRGLTAIIGNLTSYGPYLMDKRRQSRFMRSMGWQTTDAVVKRERKKIVSLVQKEIKKLLES